MPLIDSRRTLGALLILLALQLVSCDGQGSAARADACRVAQPPSTLDTRIPESSGVAVSRKHNGVIWTHNDSGEKAELFAVDAGGEVTGTITLKDASHFDWEDLAVADCASGSCLYVADTGNNNRAGGNRGQRSVVDIYRLREPDKAVTTPVEAERFRIRYPDGPKDTESLFVLPGERLFLVTRGRGDPIAIYAYPGPLRSDTLVTLEHVRTLSEGSVPSDDQVTGADATADGRWVVLRTPTALFFYAADQLLTPRDTSRGGTATLTPRDSSRVGTPADGDESRPVRADLTGVGEVQGEGVAIGEDGVVVLTSEGFGGLQGTIAALYCGFLNDE